MTAGILRRTLSGISLPPLPTGCRRNGAAQHTGVVESHYRIAASRGRAVVSSAAAPTSSRNMLTRTGRGIKKHFEVSREASRA